MPDRDHSALGAPAIDAPARLAPRGEPTEGAGAPASSAEPLLRLGLIGCGRLAEVGYVPAIAASRSVELVAVADPSRDRRDALAALVQARGAGRPATHPDAGALVDAGAVDAVVVVSPTAQHPYVAEIAATAGLPALVEKPPAPDLAGAQRLAELDPAPWLGFNRRFHQGLELGPAIPIDGPIELELELRYRRRSWKPYESADDALLDLAPHLIDLALLIDGGRGGAGRDDRARHTGAPPGHLPATVVRARVSERRAELDLELAGGRAAIRCATDRPHRERVVVRHPGGGRYGATVAGGPARAVRRLGRRREHPLVASLRRQLEAFARAARGADPGLLAPAADGVAVMRVVEAARELARGNGR